MERVAHRCHALHERDARQRALHFEHARLRSGDEVFLTRYRMQVARLHEVAHFLRPQVRRPAPVVLPQRLIPALHERQQARGDRLEAIAHHEAVEGVGNGDAVGTDHRGIKGAPRSVLNGQDGARRTERD